jgi:murein peptide amidase A
MAVLGTAGRVSAAVAAMPGLVALALALAGVAAHASPAAPALAPVAAASGDAHQVVATWCKRIASRLASVPVSTCLASELTPTGAQSVEQLPILARRFPALPAPTAIPVANAGATSAKLPVRILLLGGIHGDELTAAAIVFKWLRFIEADDARRFDWNVVPVLNPDGLLAVKPSRVNANGVDLNRNFPTPGWEKEAPRYWADRTRSDPRRFPGHAPLSEPETRWLNQEMERYKPQVIISVHAPFGVLDFDGKVEPPRRFGRLVLNQVGVYPGSLGNYGGLHKNVPVITIELPNAGAMPSDAEVRRIWQDMLKWIAQNVPAEDAPPPKPPMPVRAGAGGAERGQSDGTWATLRNWFQGKKD